ncbi:hypothetical protein BU24DRAFT_457541 [Aaosphaeria arxii CBS 175.79]|uniref:Phytochrome chromophore attachment site domain-containing protein n=1 Tax=Aaosphaeria arxii CBS 175.79 TaxID=1450172 RepID=A0A6A5Y8C4_9PLEO|nr:uncharacterized protein BU24DRAFT_457541 [Aaosphaeria arxii CBS 175.79]KAF2021566.1 hypothetical protein BU24DRAFT_457541 [Aaosphaeria arxii CBS 175.79]
MDATSPATPPATSAATSPVTPHVTSAATSPVTPHVTAPATSPATPHASHHASPHATCHANFAHQTIPAELENIHTETNIEVLRDRVVQLRYHLDAQSRVLAESVRDSAQLREENKRLLDTHCPKNYAQPQIDSLTKANDRLFKSELFWRKKCGDLERRMDDLPGPSKPAKSEQSTASGEEVGVEQNGHAEEEAGVEQDGRTEEEDKEEWEKIDGTEEEDKEAGVDQGGHTEEEDEVPGLEQDGRTEEENNGGEGIGMGSVTTTPNVQPQRQGVNPATSHRRPFRFNPTTHAYSAMVNTFPPRQVYPSHGMHPTQHWMPSQTVMYPAFNPVSYQFRPTVPSVASSSNQTAFVPQAYGYRSDMAPMGAYDVNGHYYHSQV